MHYRRPSPWRCVLLASLLLLLPALRGAAHTPASEMTDAAQRLVITLTPQQKEKISFEFGSDERLNWHFIPRPRKGLPFKEMTAVQQRLAHALLASGLSQRGYAKSLTIMTLEAILKEAEAGKGPVRDEELYYVSIFGTPGDTRGWGWRVEGHHLAMNFTIANGEEISGSPSFFGTNPADVLDGPRAGLRVLGAEEDLGRALMTALSPEQRAVALLSTNAPKDILTAAERKVKPLPEAGIAYGKLKKEQQAQLRGVVEEYVTRYRSEVAAADFARIQKGGWDKVRFAWAGSLTKHEGHYYRVQGPTFLLEYDNTQNNANHVHAVWREFNGDFGEDILQRHYEEHHHQ
ncbi:MAG TPA: hypothetical protein DCM86_05520 [Verrucomicrobiales bacterium]|nr:hypothetical protein [Verrucomicrobiales bacterium]